MCCCLPRGSLVCVLPREFNCSCVLAHGAQSVSIYYAPLIVYLRDIRCCLVVVVVVYAFALFLFRCGSCGFSSGVVRLLWLLLVLCWCLHVVFLVSIAKLLVCCGCVFGCCGDVWL